MPNHGSRRGTLHSALEPGQLRDRQIHSGAGDASTYALPSLHHAFALLLQCATCSDFASFGIFMYALVSKCLAVPVNMRPRATSCLLEPIPILWSQLLYVLPTLNVIFGMLYSRYSSHYATVKVCILCFTHIKFDLCKTLQWVATRQCGPSTVYL